jgi:hypothetical protein
MLLAYVARYQDEDDFTYKLCIQSNNEKESIKLNTDSSYLFYGLTSLESISGFENLSALEDVETFEGLFYNTNVTLLEDIYINATTIKNIDAFLEEIKLLYDRGYTNTIKLSEDFNKDQLAYLQTYYPTIQTYKDLS